MLERRRIDAAPGVNLARGIYESALSPDACEERLSQRLMADDGRFGASALEKQILLRFTEHGARLRVPGPRPLSWFLYYLRFRPTPAGSEIEVCPVIRPWAVAAVAIWLLTSLAAVGVGLSMIEAHRTLARLMAASPLVMIPLWGVVHFTVFGRESADRALVLALLAHDLEARPLQPLRLGEP